MKRIARGVLLLWLVETATAVLCRNPTLLSVH